MFNIDNILKLAIKHHYFFNKIPMIHVGGTNGKGSVCSMLSHILKNSYRVGLYVSPYDQNRFDNIKINDETVDYQIIKRIMEDYQQDFLQFQLSEFEIDTWVALKVFDEYKVDIAVIEVGMGGLDDATNIIYPILSVITNVGSDHKDILGKTVEEIATKKAGIIKPHVPVVIGLAMDVKAFQIIDEKAQACRSKLHIAESSKIVSYLPYLEISIQDKTYSINTQASYQKDNFSIVLKAIEVLNHQGFVINQQAIELGLRMPILTKRFEYLSNHPLIIADAAHNLEGALALINTLQECHWSYDWVMIISILKDKPYQKMIQHYQTLTKDIWFLPFDHPRALPIDELKEDSIIKMDSIEEVIQKIKNQPQKKYLFTGSLYFLRAIYPQLKGAFNHGKK